MLEPLPPRYRDIMNSNKINRADFLKNMIRIIMGSLLVFIAGVLARRISTGSDCSSCPGKGICSGDSDCEKFLTEKR
jgi:hypothetical protein